MTTGAASDIKAYGPTIIKGISKGSKKAGHAVKSVFHNDAKDSVGSDSSSKHYVASKTNVLSNTGRTFEIKFEGSGKKPPNSVINLCNSAIELDNPAKYRGGQAITFDARDIAKGYGTNPEIQNAARKFFGSATNAVIKDTDIKIHYGFRVTEFSDGTVIMERFAKSRDIGFLKRFIQITDNKGNILLSRKETINKSTNKLQNLKIRTIEE